MVGWRLYKSFAKNKSKKRAKEQDIREYLESKSITEIAIFYNHKLHRFAIAPISRIAKRVATNRDRRSNLKRKETVIIIERIHSRIRADVREYIIDRLSIDKELIATERELKNNYFFYVRSVPVTSLFS